MGLAASQARLLTITSRLSSNELRQQRIAHDKMRLANDSDMVSQEYSKALNNQTLNFQNKALTYNDLIEAGYSVKRVNDGAIAGKSALSVFGNSNQKTTQDSWKIYEDDSFTGYSGSVFAAGTDSRLVMNLLCDTNRSENKQFTVSSDSSNGVVGVWVESIDAVNSEESAATITRSGRSIHDLYKSAGTPQGVMILGTTNIGNNPSDRNNIASLTSLISSNLTNLGNSISSNIIAGFAKLPGADSNKISQVVKNTTNTFINQYKANLIQDSSVYASTGHFDDSCGMHNENALAMSAFVVQGQRGIAIANSYNELAEDYMGHKPTNNKVYAIDAGLLVQDILNSVVSQIGNVDTKDSSSGNFLEKSHDGIVLKAEYTQPGFVPQSSLSGQIKNNPNFLIQGLLSGYFMLVDSNGNEVSLTSDTNFTTVYDTSDDAAAEAKYNTEIAKINRKEKMLDMQMKQLDTEYQALTKEIDSVKSIISDHASKDFNMFS